MHTNPIATALFTMAVFFSIPAYADLPPAYEFKLLFSDFRGTSYATDINNAGQVVGNQYYDSQPVLWDKGSLTYLTAGGIASAINDQGEIAGSLYVPASTSFEAVVWKNHNPTILGHLADSNYNQALGINNAGQIVGVSAGVPTLWNGTTPIQLKTPAGEGGTQQEQAGTARAINNNGQIVGEGWAPVEAAGMYHAMLWEGNTVTDLDPDFDASNGYHFSSASSINDLGQIVGIQSQFTDQGYTENAALWEDGTVANLGAWNPRDINDQGLIVGLRSGERFNKAVIWADGKLYDLDSFLPPGAFEAGWRLGVAAAINDKGQIVGGAYNQNLQYDGGSAFLLTPIPEPESYAMLMAGLSVIGFAARRRKDALNAPTKLNSFNFSGA